MKYDRICFICVRSGCHPRGARGSVGRAIHTSWGRRATVECSGSAMAQVSVRSCSSRPKSFSQHGASILLYWKLNDVKYKHHIGAGRRSSRTSATRAVQHVAGSGNIAKCKSIPADVKAAVTIMSNCKAEENAVCKDIEESVALATGATHQTSVDLFYQRTSDEAADLAVSILLFRVRHRIRRDMV
eukprot:360740-Chlamydomonas_euryale.AAC.1